MTYITIQQEVFSELKLRGNEAIVFSLIASYGDAGCWCSYAKIGEMLNIARRNTIKVFQRLESKGLIKAESTTGSQTKLYKAVVTKNHSTSDEKSLVLVTKNHSTSDEKSLVLVTKNHSTSDEKSPNNKDINNIDIKVIRKKAETSSAASQDTKKFIKPTVEQLEAYIKEKNYHFNAAAFWNFYESKNWYVGSRKMSNWKSACVTWEVRQQKEKTQNFYKYGKDVPRNNISDWGR